jgi:hypothetical protein
LRKGAFDNALVSTKLPADFVEVMSCEGIHGNIISF